MALVIHDTLRRVEVPFETREPGRAAIYVCGPTVYDDAHVGHGRFAIVFDVLNRYLRWSGYEVTFAMNVTDVEDKIIARSQRESVSAFELAERYTRSWNRDMDALGVLPPEVQPRATGHILEMQELIAALVDAGHAYPSNGNVLFRVRSFPGYGKLSGRRLEEMQQGEDSAGVAKEDPADFALWKAAKPGEPSWSSPWGRGRPGWHIECSAMAARHLGHAFDLHGGGLDLVFPHHENEIAQHEAAHGEPFARHWMHNGMLRMDEAKMAKSLGNVVPLSVAARRWGAGPLRLWYLGASYRSPLTFDQDLLDEGVVAHGRLATFVRNARAAGGDVAPDRRAAEKHRDAFTRALDDDLNTPAALAALFDLVAQGNELLAVGDRGDAAVVAGMADTLVELADDVLGLALEEPLARATELRARIEPLVDDLLERREEARRARDFAAADAIRDRLARCGVVVEDRAGGPRWHVELPRP